MRRNGIKVLVVLTMFAGLASLAGGTRSAPAGRGPATGGVAAPGGARQAPQISVAADVFSRMGSVAGPTTTKDCEKLFRLACYEPAQLQLAYDEGPLFRRGIDGRGQTIAIVDPFGSPTIRSDLHSFDLAFELPDPRLRVIQPAGKVPPFDPNDRRMILWASETTLDVEWAHAMAPRATILLVETPVSETEGTAGFPQIVRAEDYVVHRHLAGVISQSFEATEQTFPRGLHTLEPLRKAYMDAFFSGVTVLASAGDTGATDPVNPSQTLLATRRVTTWPASDPLVTGVGGTQLHLNADGRRTAPDSVWNDGYNRHLDKLFFDNRGPDALAGGGGRSALFPEPWYQWPVTRVVKGARGVPDVSMSAACNGAVDVYESFPGVGTGWYLTCGTSESTPLLAGIVALADQVAGHPVGLINPALYVMSELYARGVVDIKKGDNAVSFHQDGRLVTVRGFSAARGYDLASGVGTVDAAAFVPELAYLAGGRHFCWGANEPFGAPAGAPAAAGGPLSLRV